MKICPKCNKVYPNKYEKCNECQNDLVICTKEDLLKTTTVKEIKPTKETNIPKCPTCGSTNIEKISSLNKAAGAVMFGLFSKTAKSQFKCKNCGYKW